MADGDRRTDGSRGLSVVGLTQDSKLITFRADNPGRIRDVDKVTGLKGDQSLVGIDYRVQDGQLYGVGDAGGVYTIDRRGYASKVSQLTVALNGMSFGVDFNPAANRLRVVSDTGQNLRHNIDDPNGVPAAGTTANDTTLTYPATPTTPTTTAVGVGAAAYTNNDLDAVTATTLFDVDSNLDQVVIQSPANAGLSSRLESCASTAWGGPASTSTAASATARPSTTRPSPSSRSTVRPVSTTSPRSPVPSLRSARSAGGPWSTSPSL